MAAVVIESKAKLVELGERLEAVRAEQAVLECEMQAYETVITCYDPDFRSSL